MPYFSVVLFLFCFFCLLLLFCYYHDCIPDGLKVLFSSHVAEWYSVTIGIECMHIFGLFLFCVCLFAYFCILFVFWRGIVFVFVFASHDWIVSVVT